MSDEKYVENRKQKQHSALEGKVPPGSFISQSVDCKNYQNKNSQGTY